MIEHVLLDLDGVIIDWVQGYIDWYEIDHVIDEHTSYDGIDKWAAEKGMSRSESYRGLTEEFWLGLKTFPWAPVMLDFLEPFRPVILTSPTLDNAGYRQAWIAKNMPKYFRQKRYLIGPAKWAAASPNALLIDDKPENLEAFEAVGGHTIRFPQPWNGGVDFPFKDPYEQFKAEFLHLKELHGIQVSH